MSEETNAREAAWLVHKASQPWSWRSDEMVWDTKQNFLAGFVAGSEVPSHPDEEPLVDSRYEYGIAAHPAFGNQVTPIMHDDPRQPDRRRRIDTYAWQPTDPNGDTHNER